MSRTEQDLKQKNKRIDLAYRKRINVLEKERDELLEKLASWQDDNRELQKDNLELMDTVRTINKVLRGIIFKRCDECGKEWTMRDIKEMMKIQIVACPNCELAVQIK